MCVEMRLFQAALVAFLFVAAQASSDTCSVAEGDRLDCGHTGTSQGECENVGCCWKAVDPNPKNIPWCFRKGRSPGGSCSSNYCVTFDGNGKAPFQNYCQGDNGCGQESNNLASHTMKEGDAESYAPVRVVVTSLKWNSGLGEGWNIRPSHLQGDGTIGEVDASDIHSGRLSFTVHRPCQVSVEIGDEWKLFSNEDSYRNFANLILSFNPPETSWPHKKPKITNSSCTSSETGRSCVLGASGSSCSDWIVKENQDLYFAGEGTSYTWGSGCGDNPKQIQLRAGGRVFLDEDVLVNARILSEDAAAGLYGYGYVNNQFMNGKKLPTVASNVVSLTGSGSEVLGVTVLDSTYRNIQIGGNSKVSFTKSFAWNTETDCINVRASGTSILNNFFKTNDDCLKGYQRNTLFADNVIWHKNVGRALMLSWGNIGEDNDLDSTTRYIRTSIIHDELTFSSQSTSPRGGVPLAFGYQVSMIYYSALINAQHSPHNVIGTATSPVLIEDLHIESQVGSVMLLTNGYAGLDNKAGWMGKDGCTGNVNLKIKNLNMSRVTRVAAKSVVGGCNIDQNYPSVANGQCICKSSMAPYAGCSGDHSCGVAVSFDGIVDPTDGQKFKDNFLVGDNAHVSGLSENSLLYA